MQSDTVLVSGDNHQMENSPIIIIAESLKKDEKTIKTAFELKPGGII